MLTSVLLTSSRCLFLPQCLLILLKDGALVLLYPWWPDFPLNIYKLGPASLLSTLSNDISSVWDRRVLILWGNVLTPNSSKQSRAVPETTIYSSHFLIKLNFLNKLSFKAIFSYLIKHQRWRQDGSNYPICEDNSISGPAI